MLRWLTVALNICCECFPKLQATSASRLAFAPDIEREWSRHHKSIGIVSWGFSSACMINVMHSIVSQRADYFARQIPAHSTPVASSDPRYWLLSPEAVHNARTVPLPFNDQVFRATYSSGNHFCAAIPNFDISGPVMRSSDISISCSCRLRSKTREFPVSVALHVYEPVKLTCILRRR